MRFKLITLFIVFLVLGFLFSIFIPFSGVKIELTETLDLPRPKGYPRDLRVHLFKNTGSAPIWFRKNDLHDRHCKLEVPGAMSVGIESDGKNVFVNDAKVIEEWIRIEPNESVYVLYCYKVDSDGRTYPERNEVGLLLRDRFGWEKAFFGGNIGLVSIGKRKQAIESR